MTEKELAYQIHGAVWDVYNVLGPGLLESIYEEACVTNCNKEGLKLSGKNLSP